MSERAYHNAAQERGYAVLLVLAGNEFIGLTPTDIAKAIGTSASNITRDLSVLQKVGLAEQLVETGRWRLGPKLVQIATSFQLHLDKSRRRLDEVTQRYTRQSN